MEMYKRRLGTVTMLCDSRICALNSIITTISNTRSNGNDICCEFSPGEKMNKLWEWIKKDWKSFLCYIGIGAAIGFSAATLIEAMLAIILVITFMHILIYLENK